MDEEGAGIYVRESAHLDRYVQIGVVGGRVISVAFPESLPENAAHEHPLLDRIVVYLNGREDSFEDVETGLTVSTDHRSVLESTRKIPYGQSVDVEQLARTSGLDADDHETVRNALRANPVPLVVPDHRVRDTPSGAPTAVERRLRAIEGL
ncbi:MGMT family protein [Halocatena pleomorpha]|uniref:Methylated-DNA--[protein]-cysteine S-methyltransferase n=1 Tax=Halocatena pleomorpha TaxID=1785090 RepID=A0A3P3R8F1_9EURY|nr:MGMT family protein [Halocatena pleomorpha]RRJ28920.1 methylated-DNA--[protein]-cysteine S-methyltransferase [Halocatena pleomorpha]